MVRWGARRRRRRRDAAHRRSVAIRSPGGCGCPGAFGLRHPGPMPPMSACASNGAWGKGAGKTFNGGVGQGAAGNEGTSATVKNTEGAITYNEWSFAQQQSLFAAKIVTSAGPDPVGISGETVGKTIAAAKVNAQGNDLVLDTSSFYKPSQPGAYPIVLATYELVCSKYPDAEVGKAVRAFLQSTIGPGQAGLTDNNGYVPLPADFKSRVSIAVNAIA
ncbi:MAG: substrate-binding domain-containing protein [Mycolicibacterium sp.]|nr:substrate-binding domain-containing protein [Mycolicibacterium sp.]